MNNTKSMEQSVNMQAGKRLMSLDALRGFDMFWIIGGEYIFKELAKATNNSFLLSLVPQLEHAEWLGYHAYDLIWPLFLFIVGCSIPFSFGKLLERGVSKKEIYWKIIKRTFILYLLGLILDCRLLEYDFSKISFYNGALHTIAAGYLIASFIFLNTRLKWQIILIPSFLIIYWLLLVAVPVPGFGAGVLTPDGNFAIYIERIVLGSVQQVGTYAYVLPSIMFGCMVLFGAVTGQLLRSNKSEKTKVLWLAGLGVSCLAVGLIWSEWFPFIKKIKTSSFVVFSEGWCFLLLALFYYVIDVLKKQKLAFPFVVIGVNPLVAYMATRLFQFTILANILIGGLEVRLGFWFGFFQTTIAFSIVWLILFWMYKKKSFVKI